MTRTIERAERLEGVLRVPGDKSISHRALILGAIARGKQVIEGIAHASDVESTARCLRTLGSFVEEMPDGRTLVLSNERRSHVTLDAGNSGTTARLLAGMTAGLGIHCTIDGDASLRRRPMARVVEPLSRMGATLSAAPNGTLPVDVGGGRLHGITYTLPVASAQVKSAILIAGLFAQGETTVIEPVATRDHTERMLTAMGVEVRREGNSVSVTGGGRPEGTRITVPGDFSTAAYFIVAAVCLPGSDVFLPMTGINPTRTGLLDVLRRMGAGVTLESADVVSGEPCADVAVHSTALTELRGVDIDDPALIASIIDEVPVIAVAATQAAGTTRIRGAAELRNKESDRVRAIVDNLRALGANVAEHDDGFSITGPTRLRGARVSSFGDHRIAMAMAVAGLVADGATEIVDAAAVDVSYPDFFNSMLTLTRREG
jgi:3-phosphoshikimate 1-carboxyvinyltransferase